MSKTLVLTFPKTGNVRNLTEQQANTLQAWQTEVRTYSSNNGWTFSRSSNSSVDVISFSGIANSQSARTFFEMFYKPSANNNTEKTIALQQVLNSVRTEQGLFYENTIKEIVDSETDEVEIIS
jgi:sulfite reductase alpha subunit-like flavoprotein